MSPCTAKLSAFRNKQLHKYGLLLLEQKKKERIEDRQMLIPNLFCRGKPKSLFAQASAKKLEGASSGEAALFGCKSAIPAAQQNNPFGN